MYWRHGTRALCTGWSRRRFVDRRLSVADVQLVGSALWRQTHKQRGRPGVHSEPDWRAGSLRPVSAAVTIYDDLLIKLSLLWLGEHVDTARLRNLLYLARVDVRTTCSTIRRKAPTTSQRVNWADNTISAMLGHPSIGAQFQCRNRKL